MDGYELVKQSTMDAAARGSRRRRGAVCWNSLPYDVVGRIADLFLATNDVDCYMDFRAVCRDWRRATDDPSGCWDDMRFWPRRWIVLHVEEFDDAGLLLNTSTGRFLHRGTAMASVLRTHRVATTAAGALLVLEDKDSSRTADAGGAVRVLNPLTGHSVRFRAPVPSGVRINNSIVAVLGHHPSPTLVLRSHLGELLSADPDSERFVKYTTVSQDSLVRQAMANGVYGNLTTTLLPFARDHPAIMAAAATTAGTHCYNCTMVESGGETLAIVRRWWWLENPHPARRVDVYRVTTTGLVGPVKSIGGGRAIFVGDSRCLSVDAGRFPGVDGDCIYYMAESVEGYHHILEYDMKKEKEERVIGAPLVTDHRPPFSIIQLLCCYTFDIHLLVIFAFLTDTGVQEYQDTAEWRHEYKLQQQQQHTELY